MKTKGYLFTLSTLFIAVILAIYVGHSLDYNYAVIIAGLNIMLLVATVSALYYQNKRLSAQMKIAENDTFYKLALEVDKAFLENYDLWPYFNDGKEIEADCNKEKLFRIEALAILKLDYYEHVIGLYEENKLKKAWDTYFIEGFRSGPALRMAYKKNEKWLGSTLKDIFNKAASTN